MIHLPSSTGNALYTDDLLARTAFYKVGHHASHNATLVATEFTGT